MCRMLYRLMIGLVGLAVRAGRSKDLEIIVLRHQLGVLHRTVDRPAVTDHDRALLGAIAQALPQRLRQGWIVTPETLLPRRCFDGIDVVSHGIGPIGRGALGDRPRRWLFDCSRW